MVLEKVDTLMGNSAQAAAWREFLLIDALKNLSGTQKMAVGNPSEGEDYTQAEQLENARRRAIAGEVCRVWPVRIFPSHSGGF